MRLIRYLMLNLWHCRKGLGEFCTLIGEGILGQVSVAARLLRHSLQSDPSLPPVSRVVCLPPFILAKLPLLDGTFLGLARIFEFHAVLENRLGRIRTVSPSPSGEGRLVGIPFDPWIGRRSRRHSDGRLGASNMVRKPGAPRP